METLSKFIPPGVGLALTIAFGFLLSRLGKPYHGTLFNIHKLIALGAVVLVIVQLSKMGVAGSPLLIAALVVAGLCAVALFASGAMMSIGKLDYSLTLTTHRIALTVLVIASGTAAYLLNASPALVK